MGFRDNISDFYHWMVQFGNVNAKSRTNYISWLKFMAGRYELDADLSEGKIRTIINDERRALSSRIGQGLFRERLILYWSGCSITRCRLTNILIASHIKPWRTASNEERLDVFNGLLLTPNYDKLFDLGFIAFDNNGRILFSKEFLKSERTILGIDGHIRLVTIEEQHFKYLKFHRENCLIQ